MDWDWRGRNEENNGIVASAKSRPDSLPITIFCHILPALPPSPFITPLTPQAPPSRSRAKQWFSAAVNGCSRPSIASFWYARSFTPQFDTNKQFFDSSWLYKSEEVRIEAAHAVVSYLSGNSGVTLETVGEADIAMSGNSKLTIGHKSSVLRQTQVSDVLSTSEEASGLAAVQTVSSEELFASSTCHRGKSELHIRGNSEMYSEAANRSDTTYCLSN
ncbi:hypothetical protein RJ640_024806 [Escallonia rubra]|uniref:Uncharacterized protein n=1 Tax=Escallonia rubra TaxID=112253 RepID=A0AA88UDJ0_9ASTE|nr:hypothetical protein RJ640_024806 [Escallonia rubra]